MYVFRRLCVCSCMCTVVLCSCSLDKFCLNEIAVSTSLSLSSAVFHFETAKLSFSSLRGNYRQRKVNGFLLFLLLLLLSPFAELLISLLYQVNVFLFGPVGPVPINCLLTTSPTTRSVSLSIRLLTSTISVIYRGPLVCRHPLCMRNQRQAGCQSQRYLMPLSLVI